MEISATVRKLENLYTRLAGNENLYILTRQFMRISILLSFILLISFQLLMAIPARGQNMSADQITMGMEGESLLSGIKKIEGQTSFRFYYRKADVKEIGALNLAAATRTVEKTLYELLKNTTFSFRQIDNHILLEKNQRQTGYAIKGRITGADHSAIGMASLRIIRSNDQRIIATTLADTGGRFTFTVYEQGDYLLKVSSVAADSLSLKITVAKDIQLADIVLYSSAKQLSNVTITGKRPLITQEADRITYDLQADPQSKVSSLLDMMRKVPYLSVDGDENILLKGSSGYRVFINGRPSAIVERNPKDVLRSIPASTVKSIEVITTPPSKYDAEGLAGIINIITVKEVDNGYHGTVNVSEKGPGGGPGTGGAFTFKQGKLGLSALAGISRSHAPETSGEITRTTSERNATYLNQNSLSTSDSHTRYAGMEISYGIDTLNLISGQLNWSSSKTSGAAMQTSQLTGNGETLERYHLTNDNDNKGNNADATLNYQLGFRADKDQALTISYRYLHYTSNVFSNLEFSDVLNYTDQDNHQSNGESLTEHTAQADYVQPLDRIMMEVGLKGIFRTNRSDFQYRIFNPVTGGYDLDGTRSNVFDNNQNVLAAYNSYEYKTTVWQFKAGVRAEQTIIDGTYTAGSSEVKQKYLNVVPSIVINRKFGAQSSLSLTYSNRIQRPAIAQLNPFTDRSNPDFQTSGNPDLKPVTSSALQLSYFKSAKATFNMVLGYLFFSRVINPISTYDPVNNITLTRYENFGKGRVFKTNIYFSYPITGQWTFTLNTDLRHVNYYAINGITLRNAGFMAYAYVSSGYSFKKGWHANADFTLNSGGVSRPQGKENGFTASTFSVNKELVQNKLTLSASVTNLFTRYRYRNETLTGLDFLQTTNSQSYYRRFAVSLNYKFGKLESEIRKNKRGIKNDDLSN